MKQDYLNSEILVIQKIDHRRENDQYEQFLKKQKDKHITLDTYMQYQKQLILEKEKTINNNRITMYYNSINQNMDLQLPKNKASMNSIILMNENL